MGILNVVTLTAELAVLLWYVLTPVVNNRTDVLHADLRTALHPKQSLAAIAGLSLLRLALFTYTRHSSKRAPATRVFVFFVFLAEAVLGALSCLQPVIYWQDPHAFVRIRALPWGTTYVYTLLVLSLASALLQFGYILQLNNNRGRLADATLMRDVLHSPTATAVGSSSYYYHPLHHDEDFRLALWRTKWQQLVQPFQKKKPTDPTFDAIVRLYAHRDSAVEHVARAYDRNPLAFEFYLPQLCSFLLHGAFVASPQLCLILLDKCARSHVFAHKVLWYLQSYCVASPAFTSLETTKRVKMLIDEVADRGDAPARAIEWPPLEDVEIERSMDATDTTEAAALLRPRDTTSDDYCTFQDVEAGGSSSNATSPFERETTFLTALANLSSNLRAVAFSDRNTMLRQWLTDIQLQYLPSNSLYIPIGDPFHRLKRLHVAESFTFSTRERVPFLLCCEVVNYTSSSSSSSSPVAAKKSTRPTNNNKRSASLFRNRRFTLSLWDNNNGSSSQNELKATTDDSTPSLVSSPDAAKLGFWSEQKASLSPRKRSFSQHLSSAIPQPKELFTGLLDSLAQKLPGGGNGSGNNSKSSSTTTTTTATRRQHSASEPRSAATEALLSNSTYSDKYDNDEEDEENDKVIQHSASQPLPTSAASNTKRLTIDTGAPFHGRRVAPGGPLVSPSVSSGVPHVAVAVIDSPTSDSQLLLASPQSLGSPPSYSPRPLARFDSTDQFLLTLSERDRKWMAEDDADANATNEALLSGTNATTRRSLDEPLVIFTERWADKERRLQALSPFGALPGWRLLPVIVKSNDDLRQEQLASQLIHQFAKVFAEGNVPVYVRPYDVIAISPTAGLVEAIADTISIDSLKRNDPSFTTLLDFFARHFGDDATASSPSFRDARTNFVRSMAGYAIICYLLQVKDRHNGNLLLDAEGHILHIDFGYILSNHPGNVAFEQAPFKLTADFVELMGGPRSASFRQFRSLCVRAFLVARKYRHRFILLVEMMLTGNEHLPCFAGDPRGTVERLAARFQPELDINACEDFVHSLIDASLDNWRTKWYDKYQRWCVGVF